MKSKPSKNVLLLFSLLVAILIMGIGYASINSITGEIQGKLIANVQDGVFITNVEYVDGVDADLNTSEIKKYVGTLMQSTVKLSGTNPSSEITYKVTVYNNSNMSSAFLNVLYDGNEPDFYDNPNIIFEIKDTGFKVGDVINAHETKDIYITFKYKDGTIPENTVLNSYLNFKIAEPNRLVVASQGDSSSKYLGSTITKNKIETIKFELGETEPVGTKSSFDASEKQNKSIIGYYTDIDNNGLYELTFLSDEIIVANKNADSLFRSLSSLKEITFDNFSTFGVTAMTNMFRETNVAGLDLSSFDTSKVTNMTCMFYFCKESTTLDVTNFNTSNVTHMNYMFADCHAVKELDVSKFNTSKVVDMQYMFCNCNNLAKLDVTNFNTSNVTNMKHMFENLSKITTLDVSKFNTSKVTEMAGMFYGMRSVTKLDLSNFNTSNCTRMDTMFQYMNNLTELKLSDKFNTAKVNNMFAMFYQCQNLASLDISNFNTSNVTNMGAMFYKCQNLASLDISNFNTSKVTNMANIFNACTGLTSLDCSSFDTARVKNMQYMFTNCSRLTNVDCSSFNTSNVTEMSYMFYQCTSLTSLNLSNFNTKNVTNMNRMLAHTNIFTLDLRGFNTSKVTNMQKMFSEISNLTTIYVTEFNSETGIGWTVPGGTVSTDMFFNCKNIKGGNGTTYNANYRDATYARIDTAETPGYFTNILDKQ